MTVWCNSSELIDRSYLHLWFRQTRMMDRRLSQPCIQFLPFFVDSPPLISTGNCQSVVAVEVLELRCLKEVDKHIVHIWKFVSPTPKFGIKFVTNKSIHRVISEPESNLSPSQHNESLASNSPQSSFAATMASGVVNGKCDVFDDTINMISERYCNPPR